MKAGQLPGGHTAGVVADALADAITGLPSQLRRSITGDQGKEMAEHARFSVATGVPVYFCDPHSPGSGRSGAAMAAQVQAIDIDKSQSI